MRPVDKSLYTENRLVYNPYGDAKDDLFEAIGCYCSYCEREGFHSALAVEHIENKYTHPFKEFNWNNFLLCCPNCNSCKGIKSVADKLLPHCDNTFELFIYLESGRIQYNSNLSLELQEKAEAVIHLVGLNRIYGCKIRNENGELRIYKGHDKLWQERKKAWVLGQRYLEKYQNSTCDIETIKDLALKCGFWSIWVRAFENFPEVQKELINSFKGTRKEFFQNILNS